MHGFGQLRRASLCCIHTQSPIARWAFATVAHLFRSTQGTIPRFIGSVNDAAKRASALLRLTSDDLLAAAPTLP